MNGCTFADIVVNLKTSSALYSSRSLAQYEGTEYGSALPCTAKSRIKSNRKSDQRTAEQLQVQVQWSYSFDGLYNVLVQVGGTVAASGVLLMMERERESGWNAHGTNSDFCISGSVRGAARAAQNLHAILLALKIRVIRDEGCYEMIQIAYLVTSAIVVTH